MDNLLYLFLTIHILINLSFFVFFELQKPSVRDFIPIAVICSGASLGRLIFSFIPQVQPVTVLVIITGAAYGPLYGYITGSLCALFSNMLLGQGLWTFFQMTAWGAVGFFAGLIASPFKSKKGYTSPLELIAFLIYGFFSAILFSVITDSMTISYLGKALNFASAIATFITGIIFNIGHGIFNVILILILYKPLKRKLIRCRRPR